MTNSYPSRVSGRCFLAFALAAGALSVARAQNQLAIKLDDVVVSASRTASDPSTVPSSVTVLPLNSLQASQVFDLQTALSQVAGVSVASYGASGSQSSLYIRGGSNAQTLFLVDGVRMSTRQTDFYSKSVIGGMGLAGFDRVEVLRGPQGTLYGSSAMGGVILMETAHGSGPFSGSLSGEAGSFNSRSGDLSVQGAAGKFSYSASFGSSFTENDRPNNDSRVTSFSTRLEIRPSDGLVLGATFRAQEGKYKELGSTDYPSPGDVEADNYLGTAYGEYALGELRSRLTFGWNQMAYTYTDTSGSPWASNSYNRSTRRILDWQNTWAPSSDVGVVFGYNTERSTFVTPSLGDSGLKDSSDGVYLSADWRALKELSVTGGIRYDHFDTAGNATTGRTGAAYRFLATKTKVRATVGSGFAAPGLTERYGDMSWYVANSNLRPEKSNGWDFGVDQQLGSRASVGVTYFQNHFRDMIVANYYGGGLYQFQNVSRAQTRGVEFETSFKLTDTLRFKASYTYLDAYDLSSNGSGYKHDRVAYKPRNSGDAELSYQATRAWLVGAGLHVTADRLSTATTRIEDFTTVRVFTSYKVTEQLTLRARVENLLDEKYSPIAGYPALPLAAFGGVEWRF